MTEQLLTMTITGSEIQNYVEISGDDNPIHVDNKAALAAGLPTVCAHGMLVTGKLLGLLIREHLLSTTPRRTSFSYINPIPANEQLHIYVQSVDGILKVNIRTKAGLAIKGTIEF